MSYVMGLFCSFSSQIFHCTSNVVSLNFCIKFLAYKLHISDPERMAISRHIFAKKGIERRKFSKIRQTIPYGFHENGCCLLLYLSKNMKCEVVISLIC